MHDAQEKWKNFLNPGTLRQRMLSASLFLVAHEMLVKAVITRLHDFFLVGFNESGFRYSPAYEETVLCLDPKGKKDQWRSSLIWLEQVGAISRVDIESIRKCTDARNTFAHELNEIISGQKNPDFVSLFSTLVELVVKIDRWWIINVELETSPDQGEEEIDTESVVPGSQLVLSILYQSALGNLTAAQALYEEFVANIGPQTA